MKTRIIFGAAMIAAMVGLLVLDFWLDRSGWQPLGLPLTCLMGLLLVLAYLELERLLAGGNTPVMRLTGILCTLGVASVPLWRQLVPANCTIDPWPGAMGVAIALLFFVQMATKRTEQAIGRLAGTSLAVLYLGVLGGSMLSLRVEFGVAVLTMYLACVKLTDIGAYFTGYFLGKHKLIRWLSPGKSWEGLAGGIAAAVLVAMGLNCALGPRDSLIMDMWKACVFGASMAVVGQFGDLCESLLKRGAQQKDSGAVVPGFGGVLDIIDSPLIAAPVAYVLASLFIH